MFLAVSRCIAALLATERRCESPPGGDTGNASAAAGHRLAKIESIVVLLCKGKRVDNASAVARASIALCRPLFWRSTSRARFCS